MIPQVRSAKPIDFFSVKKGCMKSEEVFEEAVHS